jgi:predicted nucleotidyltransferase
MKEKKIEEKIIAYFTDQEGVIALMLFGSFSKGNQTSRSDVDIAVLYEHSKLPNKLDLIEFKEGLSESLEREVDLICLNTANPIIGMQIYTSGKYLLNKNKFASDSFFTNLFVDYIELKELRKPMEDTILKRKVDG